MATTKKAKKTVKAVKKPATYYEGIGRRREAVARVRLYLPTSKDGTVTIGANKIKKGQIFVNDKPVNTVFSAVSEKPRYLKPLMLTKNDERFAISVRLTGGGHSGQLEAMILGIARALLVVDTDEYRSTLKKEKLLTRDPRTRERRKPGTGGKARRAKQSPKR